MGRPFYISRIVMHHVRPASEEQTGVLVYTTDIKARAKQEKQLNKATAPQILTIITVLLVAEMEASVA